MPMRSEVAIPIGPQTRHQSNSRAVLDQLADATLNREFAAVAAFCAVGLWLTASFLHSFADFGDLVGSLALTP
jgi:hypothetical protein